jgi:hypothetical protein
VPICERAGWSAGPVPVCGRAGWSAGFEGNRKGGDSLLVSRETERGENFWGEMVLVLETCDIGFKFFFTKMPLPRG